MAGSVYEGRTFDEAVKKGLEALRLSRAEAVITTIEEGKGGFLGFGSRPFRVSVSRRPGGAIREPSERSERASEVRGGRRSGGGRTASERAGGGRSASARGSGGSASGASGSRGDRPARGGRGGKDVRPGRDERPGREAREPSPPREAREGRETRLAGEGPPAGRGAPPGRERRRQPRLEEPGGREERAGGEMRAPDHAARGPQERGDRKPEPAAAAAMRPSPEPMEGDDPQRKRRRRGRRGGRGRRRGGPVGAEGASAGEPGINGMERDDAPEFEPLMEAPHQAPPAARPAMGEGGYLPPAGSIQPASHAGSEERAPEAEVFPAPSATLESLPEHGPGEGRTPAPGPGHDRERRRDYRAEREERFRSRHEREGSDGPRRSGSPDMSADELSATSKKLTEELLTAMGFEPRVSVRAEGNRVDVTVEVDRDDDLLTGRQGETRQALQHLLNRFLNKGDGSRYHLQLEVNDFWQRREIELVELARRLADQAIADQAEVVSDYLNSQERRIVHMTLKEDARVTTFSLGTGMVKRVAVAPAGFPERSEEEPAS